MALLNNLAGLLLACECLGGAWVLPGKGAHGAGDVTAGLVGWWKFDDNDNDSIGSNNGTPTGSPSFTTGRVNNCRSFSGSNFVQMSTTEVITTNDWSVSMLVQTTGGSGFRIAAANGDQVGGAYGGMQIGIDSSGNAWVECVTSGDTLSEATGSALSASTWYNVIVTKSGTALTVYVNGTAGTPTTLPSATMDYTDNGDATRAGADSAGSGGWVGLVDELRFYNVALSAGDVTQLKNFYGL